MTSAIELCTTIINIAIQVIIPRISVRTNHCYIFIAYQISYMIFEGYITFCFLKIQHFRLYINRKLWNKNVFICGSDWTLEKQYLSALSQV